MLRFENIGATNDQFPDVHKKTEIKLVSRKLELTNFSFSFELDPASILFCPQIKTTGPDNLSNISCILLTNSFLSDFETAFDSQREESGK